MIDFLVFDLDGTLIDTLPGITEAVNLYLKSEGSSLIYTVDEVKTFIGNGARVLFKKAFKVDKVDEKEYQKFLAYYDATQVASKPFPKVIETLKDLKSAGYKLIIYSNKPDKILHDLAKKVFQSITFLKIQGQDDRYPRKPDATLLNSLMSEFSLSPKDGIYVGDSYVDVLTAKNAKMRDVIVKYGYGDLKETISYGPDILIDKFADLKEVIEKWNR
jgi:phosphoglycolate phosphatase